MDELEREAGRSPISLGIHRLRATYDAAAEHAAAAQPTATLVRPSSPPASASASCRRPSPASRVAGAVYRPLTTPTQVELALAYRKDDSAPVLTRALKIVRQSLA